MKTCARCQQPKDRDVEFNKNWTRGDGYDAYCKACTSERRREALARKAGKPTTAAPAEPPRSPLQQAVEERQARIERHSVVAERDAVFKENERLKELLTELEVAAKPAAPTVIIPDKRLGQAEAVACAIASDWHVEEEVTREEVNGKNEYNLAIAEARAGYFFKNFLKLTMMMARETKIRQIWLGLLGDFITNWLHEDAISNNLLRPGDAAWFAQNLLISGIEYLLKESDFEVVADCITGNHGRTTRRMPSSGATGTSWEVYMYRNIARHFRDQPRVQFNIPESKMLYRRFFDRFNMRVIHGDAVKFNGGSGGLTIPIKKAINEWNKADFAQLTAMGHFHQRFFGGDFIVNGSLIGYNAFAQDIKASPEEAMQTMFLVQNRNGGEVSITAPIWLDAKHKIELP